MNVSDTFLLIGFREQESVDVLTVVLVLRSPDVTYNTLYSDDSSVKIGRRFSKIRCRDKTLQSRF